MVRDYTRDSCRTLSVYFKEIQELRHQDVESSSPTGSSKATSVSAIIDHALVGLDERLESAAQNINLITASFEPLAPQSALSHLEPDDLRAMLLRKHEVLLSEWEGVQREAEILRDELKEDKWLLVFRNASDQADGMMDSLERVVNQCQAIHVLLFCLCGLSHTFHIGLYRS